MTIIRKIYAGYAVAVALLVVMAGLSIYSMGFVQAGYQDLLATDVQLRYTAQQTRYKIRDTIADMRAALLYPARRQQYIDATNANFPEVDAAVALVGKLAGQVGVGTDLSSQMSAREVVWHEGVSSVLALLASGDEKAAHAKAESLIPVGQEVVDLSTKLVLAADGLVQNHAAEVAKTATVSSLVVAVLAVLFVAIAIVQAFLIGRSVKGSLREVTDRLASSSSEILAVSAQVAAGSSHTATSISETTATVVEVKQTAALVNEKAGQLADTAQETSRVAEVGSRAVDETAANIARIDEQMNVITDSIVQLSGQTSAISDVIATVNDLAEQSNLLSVNAAIEAAKAGDQGKGFAVVAQEVRNLADQSKQAVAQVRGILSDIEKATATTVMAAELGSKSVETGAKQSIEAGEAIDRLAESINAAVQATHQTLASTEQQFAGLDQITTAMGSIKEASAQNVMGTHQIEVEAKNLRDMATALQALTDRNVTAPD